MWGNALEEVRDILSHSRNLLVMLNLLLHPKDGVFNHPVLKCVWCKGYICGIICEGFQFFCKYASTPSGTWCFFARSDCILQLAFVFLMLKVIGEKLIEHYTVLQYPHNVHNSVDRRIVTLFCWHLREGVPSLILFWFCAINVFGKSHESDLMRIYLNYQIYWFLMRERK